MPTDEPHTFECTICKQHHKTVPDTLPSGHSGHKPHCIFCLIHTLYRSIIPAAPTCRLTSEQNEKNNIIRTRKIVIGIVLPIVVLAYFAFRWEMKYWKAVVKGYGEGEGLWKDRLLWIMLCILGCAPCGCLLGFIVSVIYYSLWSIKRKRAKHRKARQQNGAGSAGAGASAPVPIEDKPLAEVRYQDLREMNETIQIVVTPPNEGEESPNKGNRASRMLGVVTNRFKHGYDGRAVRKESWVAMEEKDEERGTTVGRSRPVTEWPAL